MRITSLVSFVLLPLSTGLAQGLPAELQGFAGMLAGTVVEVGDRELILQAKEVVRTWGHSRAPATPGRVDGRLRITLRWEEGEDGAWRPVERQVAFLRTLARGQPVTMDLAAVRRDRLRLMELTREQRQQVEEARPGKRELPADLRGFSGQLTGTVAEVGDAVFVLVVSEVGKVWQGNQAPEPRSAVGRRLVIRPHGEGERQERHQRFIRSLTAGERLTVEVHDVPGRGLCILELTAEQRARGGTSARTREEFHQDLGGLQGFSGTFAGKVLEVGEHGLVLQVEEVPQVWKASRARNPGSAVGRRLLINVQWEKAGEQWRPVPRQMRFLRRLEVGERLALEVHNVEGERLHILELSEAQRQRADRD